MNPSGPVAQLARAKSAIATHDDPYRALDEAMDAVREIAPVDLLLIFISSRFASVLPALVARLRDRLHPGALIGCTASGLIGIREEREFAPSLSLLAMRLPGATVTPLRLGEWLHDAGDDPELWRNALDLQPDQINSLLLLTDPFRSDPLSLTMGLHRAYPDAAIVGAVSSGSWHQRQSWTICDGEIATGGGVAVSIGGDYTILPVVSQGCEPIGETWTITRVNRQWIEEIAGRPALAVLREAMHTVPVSERDQPRHHLLAGLAANEYQDDFRRGDFLIRSITGIDQDTGAVALGALPRVGQTIQFQARSVAAAVADWRIMLEDAAARPDGRSPVAAFLSSCTGRGEGFFGAPHHDAYVLDTVFPGLPVAGLFASGEIGPIGRRPLVHDFSTIAGLIAPRSGS